MEDATNHATDQIKLTPSTYLIALNCHPFHPVDAIEAALYSVASAVSVFRRNTTSDVAVRVFWHNSNPPPKELLAKASELGFTLDQSRHTTNGDNLNHQLDYASRHDFRIFFRVDGDDTVAAERFKLQANVLESGDYDLCGAGLRYQSHGGETFEVLPNQRPTTRDYLENKYLLHPTLAFRMEAIRESGLRYWSKRLEDKALLLQALRLKLRVGNVSIIAGTYNVHPSTRDTLAPKWLGFCLNHAFLYRQRALQLIPYAVILFLCQTLLGSNRMRRLRAWRDNNPNLTSLAKSRTVRF
ncbi:MAG: hypothetical protein ABJL99_03500 [Aliishimia sp.]